MLPKINPATTKAWSLLKEHFAGMSSLKMKELFINDKNRFSQFSIQYDDILFDYSKNIITADTLELLLQLANECKLKEAISAMFNGDIINATEHRSVLHTALRNFSKQPVYAEGNNVMPEVKKVLRIMKTFCEAIHNVEHRSHTGKRIKYIVNIGIGRSDLGPLMVTEALKPYKVEYIESYFVSNVDGTHIAET